MKRSGFIKALFVIAASPSILSLAAAKDVRIINDRERSNIVYGPLQIYTKNIQVRLGDMIRSDMGGRAMVTTVYRGNKDYLIITIYPLTTDGYTYRNIDEFMILQNYHKEYQTKQYDQTH